MNLIDQVLVTTYLKTKEEAVFRLLYSRHSRALWFMAMKLTNNQQHLAEEIVQDTWLRAIEGLAGFEWRSSLRTWMIKVMINRWRELNRKKQLVLLDDVQLSRPAETLEAMDTHQIIARLPEGYKTILLLHDLEGYKHEEIATILDIAPGTSKSQLHQARKAFRNLIKENS